MKVDKEIKIKKVEFTGEKEIGKLRTLAETYWKEHTEDNFTGESIDFPLRSFICKLLQKLRSDWMEFLIGMALLLAYNSIGAYFREKRLIKLIARLKFAYENKDNPKHQFEKEAIKEADKIIKANGGLEKLLKEWLNG